MNSPAWLRCEHCLWWKSSLDLGESYGCTYSGIPKPMTAFDRCYLWTCKRCFLPWNPLVYGGYEVVNHFYCKRLGRAKPKPKTEHNASDMGANPFSYPEFRREYDALIKKASQPKGKG